MFQQVWKSFFQCFQVLIVQVSLWNAAVVFQSTDSCYDNYSVWCQACHTALDIQEFLSSQVSAEACFCDGVVT